MTPELAALYMTWDERDRRYAHSRVKPSRGAVDVARLWRCREARALEDPKDQARAMRRAEGWEP